MSFLIAEWRKLALANYIVDEEILKKHVPFGTELDLWNGKCYVSLVGFMFKNTKLLGIKIPYHTNFEEVNLRFYVKRFENGKWKRGVVFIKEIVPKRALAFVANTIYKEHYETMRMNHFWEEDGSSRTVGYNWTKNGRNNSFLIRATQDEFDLIPESETEFITEHYWGYAKINDKKSNEYEVRHPRWSVYKILDYSIDVDFGLVYGKGFDFLTAKSPDSIMLAEGSEISVEHKKTIKTHQVGNFAKIFKVGENKH